MKTRYLFFCCLLTSSLSAALSPAPLFQDGAVLQHGKPLPVWGAAEPGQEVRVSFANQTEATTADPDGRWSVTLAPLSPSREPAEMVISGVDAEEIVRLKNIVVGEVWLASGQSNMQWRIRQSYDADLESAMADWPLIREFTVSRIPADSPQLEAEGAWTAAEKEAISEFSAVGYFFARDLHQVLEMPIGIINSSWGGTPVESWMDPASLSAPAFSAVHDRHRRNLINHAEAVARHEEAVEAWATARDAAADSGEPFARERPRAPSAPQAHLFPSALYNGMIHPLIPYALGGAIWYQGESNAPRHTEYHDLFSAMITGWREAFEQEEFPFYWVQLASFRASGQRNTEWAFLREAQTRTLELPATGQAVILDVSDVHDIHPANKQAVGRRLARLALNRAYGYDIIDSGPNFARAERAEGQMRIYFDPENSGGLKTTATALRGFELAGEDRRFFPAAAVISGNSVTLTADEVPAPVAARYAWRNAPDATLFNGAGLPAAPFRTDAWEE